MGIKLVQQAKCDMVLPYWLNSESLLEILSNEQESEELTDLTYFFFEIYNILINKLPEKINNIDKVKVVLSDITSVRNKKINNKLVNLKDQKYFYNIKNICAKELEFIRKLITDSLDLKHDFIGRDPSTINENKNVSKI